MSEKVTIMVINTVDLNCSSCYKKVKKVLCKFPQIRDQKYDEKNRKVIIRVLCCNPERTRDKLCCKGSKVFKSIEIVEDPPKPKAPEKPKEAEKPKAPEKPKETEKPKAPEKPKEAEKPKAPEKPKEAEKPKAPEKPKEAEKPKAPSRTCCGPCSQGYGGGPCYHGHGRPVPPPPGPCYNYGRPVPGPCYNYGRPVPPPPGPCYNYGRPVPPPPGPCYDYGRPYPPGPCYDYGYGYRGSRCCVSTDYFSEENAQGCTIM